MLRLRHMLETPEEMSDLQALLDAVHGDRRPPPRRHHHATSAGSHRGRLAGTPAGDAPPRPGHRDRRRPPAGRARRRLLPARHVLVQLGPQRGAHAAPGGAAAVQRHPSPGGRARRHRARAGPRSSTSTTRHCGELRQAMLDEYLPKQGPCLRGSGSTTPTPSGARIVPEKMFTFHMAG